MLARAVGRIQISRLKLFPRFMSVDASEFQKCVQIIITLVDYIPSFTIVFSIKILMLEDV